jgi:pimeloyl-ACP methyl ester carboxylesterase
VPHLLKFASRAILWDPPGHGDAPKGEPVGLGVREPKLLAALIDAIEPTDAGVVLYGWSLGAGVSIVAGARDPRVKAVIAEAPYQHPKTPARNVMRAGGYPYRWNVPILFAILGLRLGVGATWKRVYTSPAGEPQPFDRARHAARLDCPLLVIHGSADVVCPLADGEAIEHAAPQGELLAIEGAGHNNLWSNSTWSGQVKDRISEFLDRSLSPSAT